MAATRTQRGKFNAELSEKTGARLRNFSGFAPEHDVFVRGEKIGEVNAKATCEMVVANSGRTKFPRLT
jgi:hypothetical protein